MSELNFQKGKVIGQRPDENGSTHRNRLHWKVRLESGEVGHVPSHAVGPVCPDRMRAPWYVAMGGYVVVDMTEWEPHRA